MTIILSLSGAPGQPVRMDDGRLLIGNGEDAGLRIADPYVSRRHCVVEGQGEQWRIVDSSTNGTQVNGRKVEGAQPLYHGDRIRIGSAEIAVAIGTAGQGAARPAPAATQAPVATPPMGAPAAGTGAGAGAALLLALVEGYGALAADRRKARAETGAGAGDGANPLLTEGAAKDAAARLMAMSPDDARKAASEASAAIMAHQRATLDACRSALRATMEEFAPAAIAPRARDDAAAWKAYARAFEAEDGFVEHFAQEFARAYRQKAGD